MPSDRVYEQAASLLIPPAGAPGDSGAISLAPAATAGRGAARAWIVQTWQLFRRSLRAHALLIAIAAAYVGIGWIATQLLSLPVAYAPGLYSSSPELLEMTAAYLIFVGIAYGIYIIVAVRPQRPLRYFGVALRQRVFTVERLCVVLPVFVLLPLVVSAFTYFKFVIPFIRPFDLDPLLAEWDRLLHGGHAPWTLLQHFLGHPYATAVVNFFYQLWLFVTWGVLLWQCFSLARPRLRMRYLITFVLLWVLLGNVAATLLSSAGPVYYGRITGLPDPYAPLMAYLHQASTIVPLPALGVQEMLWRSYVNTNLGVGAGISAMPSLHVATSFCSVLLGFAINRRLGVGFAAFCATILIGSVHLGWHYAVDGYVAIIATWAIWWIVGRLLEHPRIAWLLWGEAEAAQQELCR